MYHEKLDPKHKNWDRVATSDSRRSKFNNSREYHREWLKEVLVMNDKNLSRNTIGVTPSQTKDMAKKLLA